MLKLPKDKVAVTPIFDPDMSPGGIIIPDIAKERCDQGIVKYIGSDVKWVKQGMYVLFSGYTGTLISMQGEGNLIIMPEEFVVAELGEVDNITVPGLYYRSRFNSAQNIEELYHMIKLILIRHKIEEIDAKNIARSMATELGTVEGVVTPIHNSYYQADYENMFNLLSQAFKESDWYRGIKVRSEKPKLEEYDNLKTH